MHSVNMFEAKSQLSRLVESIENKEEDEIIIARHGKPIARLVPLEDKQDVSKRIGVAKGVFDIPDDIDVSNDKVASLFLGSQS